MSVVGIGLDLVEVARVKDLLERHGDRFLRRICRPGEPRIVDGPAAAAHVAGLFAAKEAALKALGSGWAAGLAFRQIEVRRAAGGSPSLVLHDAAARRASELGVSGTLVSITHDGAYAAAVAVLLAAPPTGADRE